MVAATRYQTQSVGVLPAIAPAFEQLDLAATIDRIVPWEGDSPSASSSRSASPTDCSRPGPSAASANGPARPP